MAPSVLSPSTQNALSLLQTALRDILQVVVDAAGSPRFAQLQATLARMGAVADAAESVDALNPEEDAAELVGFVAGLLGNALLVTAENGDAYALTLVEDGGVEEGRAAVAFINALKLRVAVVPRGDGAVDFLCTAGGADKALLTLSVVGKQLDVVVDLASARHALDHLGRVAGTVAADRAEFNVDDLEVSRLSGVVAMGVGARSGKFTVSLEVRKELVLEGTTGGQPVLVKVGASRPALSLELDGARGEGALTLALGPVLLRCPQGALPDQDGPGGQLELKVAGLAASVVARAGQSSLEVAGVSLGGQAAVLTLDGALLGSAELVAAAGRTVSLALFSDGEAAPQLELQTPLHLALAWGEDRYTVQAGQGLRVAVAPEEQDAGDGFLTVVRGELSVGAKGARRTITAGPGKTLLALTDDNPREDETHPVLRLLDVR